MLHLITGTPGSGKTLFAVKLIHDYVKQNKKLLENGEYPREIYADIDGLNIEGVLPAPDDWRDTPDGSVIFYDEIQQRPEYKKQKGQNDIVSDLQIHRHTGHDIYGITQFPVLLHNDFKAVVGLHYHLHRGWGLSQATVYQWAYCVDSPNAKSNKRLAEHEFKFSYPKKLFESYKSATQHTHKARIPKKFIFIVIAVLIGFVFLVKMWWGGNMITDMVTGNNPSSAVETETIEETTQDLPKVFDETVVDDPFSSVGTSGIFDPMTQTYFKDINLVPVMGVKFGDKCSLYNHKGNILTNYPQSTCEFYLGTAGMMPKLNTVSGVSTNNSNAISMRTTTRRYDEAEDE